MSFTHQKFDQSKVDKLKHYLEDMAGKGQPRQYEIFVDNLKVVPRTEDLSNFENYEGYMDEDTEKIRILIYNSSLSPRNDQFCFSVSGASPGKPTEALGEIDTMIQEKLTARDREHEMASLRKELEQARSQITDAEAEAEELRQEMEAVRAGRQERQMGLFDMAAGVLQGLLRNNPGWLQRVPGGEALAGLLTSDSTPKMLPETTPPSNVTFERKAETPDLAPEQLRYLDTLRQIEAAFPQPELETVMRIIARFAEDPNSLDTVSKILKINNV
ncbi:hypothetical protein [Dinghuibacter silviterrae]|uniref:Uncharacterized protein n=1 Tax=Dinghuibacter silviterrae TaxID=1539049 RepID=A0A4R8DVI4_9BACT|nr:hypothetical protein [Dinghuibacter silviterrae]TDX01485.1 hypothetical protein EDB95_2521 [Dinghuibacter silviterrae]